MFDREATVKYLEDWWDKYGEVIYGTPKERWRRKIATIQAWKLDAELRRQEGEVIDIGVAEVVREEPLALEENKNK